MAYDIVLKSGASFGIALSSGPPTHEATVSVSAAGSLTTSAEVLHHGAVPDTGLQAWWAADDLTLANNDSVASWAGHRSIGPTLTASAQPVFKTNMVDTKPGVQFVRANSDIMQTASGAYLRNTSGATMFIVGYSTSTTWGDSGQMFCVVERNAADSDRLGLQMAGALRPTAGNIQISGRRLDSDSFTTYTTSTAVPTAVSTMRVAADYSAATLSVHLDGVSIGSTAWFTSGSTSDTDSNAIRIGGSSGSYNNLDGYVFEILIYNRILTAGEISAVETYLETKYTPYVPQTVDAVAFLPGHTSPLPGSGLYPGGSLYPGVSAEVASLTTSATVVDTATVTLPTGTATLTAAGTVVDSDTVSLSGTASLISAGTVVDTATVSLSSTASLTTSGTVVDSDTATLSTATATLTSAAVPVRVGTATATTGSALLTSTGEGIRPTTAALSATASLVTAGYVDSYRSAALSAVGSLSAGLTQSSPRRQRLPRRQPR